MLADDARRLALALPETQERDHHGRPSFRVRNTIFATLWTPETLNVMPGDELILAAVQRSPQSCSKVFWGRTLRAVAVQLPSANEEQVEDLLFQAWSQHAPRRLVAEHAGERR